METKKLNIEDPLKVSYCIGNELRDQQILINTRKVKKRLEPVTELKDEPIAIVTYGPSLNDTWEELRKFKTILTCSGAHKFLIDKGIIPSYHADLDPRIHKVGMLGTPHKDVKYLMASTVHPKYIDFLEEYDLTLWHIFATDEEAIRVLPRGEWSLTGGCIHNSGKVETEDGIKTIKWIVDNKYRGKVLSLDVSTGKFVWSKILNTIVKDNNNPRKTWVRLETAPNKSHFKQKLTCTEDHRCAVVDDILNPKVYYLPANKMIGKYSVRKPDSQIHGNRKNPLYNKEQVSIMMGIMMGDGDITKSYNFRTVHGYKQNDYINIIQNIFGGKLSEHISGFSKTPLTRLITPANAQTKLLRELFYPDNGIKTVRNILHLLDEKSLAFWYMDDGYLYKPKPVKGHPNRGHIAKLCTQGFGKEDNELLVKYFQEKWGIKCSVSSYKRSNGKQEYMLTLGVEGTKRLFKLIAKYVPESMQYKLSKEFHPTFIYQFDNKPLDFAVSYIYDVKPLVNSGQKSSKLYDLEVEKTHSFIVNKTVVHNSSIGLRLFTLARFMGYTNFHIFGMDGSTRESGTHTTEHPNAPKERFETEYKGKKYYTTPSMLFVAKETGKELDQLPDVTYTFYGEGLVQDLMKDHIPNPKHGSNIAFSQPELISKEYIQLNQKLHDDVPSYGMGGARHKDTVIKLAESINTRSILDYGAGKQMLAKSLDFAIYNYDPAVPEISYPPKPADLVICSDVLEHIERDKLQFVLDDLRRVTKKIGYFVISTRKAIKTYNNGVNCHLIVEGEEFWKKKLSRFFDIGSIIPKKDELHIIVGPKTDKASDTPEITEVEYRGTKAKFYTPNETTKWRCNTLFTKEPITIEWINSFEEGDTLLDIGANMGGYSIWASQHKKAKIIAFEPEAETYNLLQKNFILNNVDGVAYCAAITDNTGIDKLYLSQKGIGGSCHSFGEQGDKKISQGSVGLRLDDLYLHPQHIKIDVDGFEPKVIKGAKSLLMNGVKSLLVEVNTNIPEHMKMVEQLASMGFTYDQKQVDGSIRKEGAFKGCAEFLFRKTYRIIETDVKIENAVSCINCPPNHHKRWEDASKAERGNKLTIIEESLSQYVSKRIEETPLSKEPFDYLYIENVFPEDVYKRIISEIQDVEYEEIEKTRGTRGYPKRFTGKIPQFLNELLDGIIYRTITDKFDIPAYLGLHNHFYPTCSQDLLLIKDYESYQIPPHTDSTSKVISALFYLPKDDNIQDEGTSLFVPKKKGFICKSGKHHKFEDFDKVYTAPFKANSCLIFKRTDNSFHGVEPSKNIRNVLLYNIKAK